MFKKKCFHKIDLSDYLRKLCRNSENENILVGKEFPLFAV
jgi:hypothetical protein